MLLGKGILKFTQFAQFAQFKKREKYPWRSFTLSEVASYSHATLLKVTLLDGCFSCFLNFTNDTKLRKASHMNAIILGNFLQSYLQRFCYHYALHCCCY